MKKKGIFYENIFKKKVIQMTNKHEKNLLSLVIIEKKDFNYILLSLYFLSFYLFSFIKIRKNFVSTLEHKTFWKLF